MKIKLLVIAVSAVFASQAHAATNLGIGNITSPNATAVGNNNDVWGYDGGGNLVVAPLNAIAVGNNNNVQGGGLAIGSNNNVLPAAVGATGPQVGMCFGNNCTVLGNGISFAPGVTRENQFNVGARTITNIGQAISFSDAISLGQVQQMLFSQPPPIVALDPITGNFNVTEGYFDSGANGSIVVNAIPLDAISSNGLNINQGYKAGQTLDFFTQTYSQNLGFNNINQGTFAGKDMVGSGNVNEGWFSGDGLVGNNNFNGGTASGGSFGGDNSVYLGLFSGGLNAKRVNNVTAIGSNTFSDEDNGTTVGTGSAILAGATNSGAFGANSVAREANIISVGDAGNERRITNVDDPINGTDAVNLRTLQNFKGGKDFTPEINRLDGRIDKLQKRAFAGSALAMAMSSTAPDAEHASSISVGSAFFNDQGAIAASLQLRDLTSGAIINFGFGVTTQADIGGKVTATWQWNPIKKVKVSAK